MENTSSSRRDSIADAWSAAQARIEMKFRELRRLWDRVGLSDDMRHQRLETAIQHLDILVCEMLEEESQMEAQLRENIARFIRDARLLAEELHCQLKFPEESKTTLIEQEDLLRETIENLKAEKRKKMQLWMVLLGEDTKLAKALSLPQISTNYNRIPSEFEVDEMKIMLEDRRMLAAERLSMMNHWKNRIQLMIRRLGDKDLPPIVQRLLTSDVANFSVSDAATIEVEQTFNELNVQYQEFLVKLKSLVETKHEEMITLWECCGIAENERMQIKPMAEENICEELLDDYSNEVTRLRKLYDVHGNIYKMATEWRKRFDELKEYESKQNDPNPEKYRNRGGALQRELQKYNQNVHRLKQIEIELTNDPSANDVLYLGVPAMTFIQQQRDLYENEKILQKQRKQEIKRAQLEHERKFGAAPSPGPHKRLADTPMKSPMKSRCLNATRDVSKFVHSSLAAMRSPKAGPGLGRPPLPPSSSTSSHHKTALTPSSVNSNLTPNTNSRTFICKSPGKENTIVADHHNDSLASFASYTAFARPLLSNREDDQSSFIVDHK